MTTPDTVKSAVADAKNEYAQISVNKCVPCLVFTKQEYPKIVLEAAASAVELGEENNRLNLLIEQLTKTRKNQQYKELLDENYKLAWKLREQKKDENILGELQISNNLFRARIKELEGAVEGAEKALRGALYAINGREHTGFIDKALANLAGVSKS